MSDETTTVVEEQTQAVEITSEAVEKWLGTDQGKQFMQPKLDSYHTKGLNTYLDKNKEKFVSKEEYNSLVEESNQKVIESDNRLKSLTIDSKIRNQLINEGLQPAKVDLAMKLIDKSRLSLDGENLLGATTSIEGLKGTVADWFGEAVKPKGQGNPGNPNGDPGNPPGQSAEETNVNAMMKAAGL